MGTYPLSRSWRLRVPLLQRVTFFSEKVTKTICSWLGPDCVAVPSLRRRSVGPRRTGIHALAALSQHPAARPTPRRLRSACTQVAFCGVWAAAVKDQKQTRVAASLQTQILNPDSEPVGAFGGYDGRERGGSDNDVSSGTLLSPLSSLPDHAARMNDHSFYS